MDKKDRQISALQAEIVMLKEIILLMPGNLFWMDKHGSYLGCNNNLATLHKLSTPHEIIGKVNAELIEPKIAEYLDAINQEIVVTNKDAFIEELGLDVDGNRAVYLSHKMPLHNGKGEVTGILGVAFDITERKKMEEELRLAKTRFETASQAKTQFLAVVSHELHTSLNAVIDMKNFLAAGSLTPEEKKEYAHDILTTSQHLLVIINDLLNFAKGEMSRFEFTSALIFALLTLLTLTDALFLHPH
jgi:PAS domain S-box-containing protein